MTGERRRSLGRWFGAFDRVFMLPSAAGGEPVQAALEGGVVTVMNAKHPRRKTRAVEIEVP